MEPREFPHIEQQLAPVFERHGREANKLLQILREVQEIFHFIPPAAITCIAAHLGVPRTRVEGVAGFYSFLSLKPVGEYRILFSDNITDQMQGNPELMRYSPTGLSDRKE